MAFFIKMYMNRMLFLLFSSILFPLWVVDPPGAQEKVMEIASSLGLSVSVGVAHEVSVSKSGISIHL